MNKSEVVIRSIENFIDNLESLLNHLLPPRPFRHVFLGLDLLASLKTSTKTKNIKFRNPSMNYLHACQSTQLLPIIFQKITS